jgi:polysaccharide export outer membrane protein
MRNPILFALITLVTVSGCVTNKKFVLLQKDDLHRKDLPLDTMVRSYQPFMTEYRLQPNDIVYVSFESLTPEEFDFLSRPEDNFNMMQGVNMLLVGNLIEPEGTIPFPFIGKVAISGLTVFEAQNKLQQIASQYLDKPVVTVRLINYRFTVLGEVNKEGNITVNNNRITILEALGLAGGLTDLADRSIIKLIRQTGGETTVQYINLLDENIIHSPYYFIQQNDVLIVPSLRQRPYRKYFSQNLSLIISSLSLLLITLNLINTTN